jgi:outer membrane receptor for ferrienterochelin and colicin
VEPAADEGSGLQYPGAVGRRNSGYDSTGRSPYSQAEIFSLFAEDNMELTDTTMLTPALRFDHHSIVGNNWSPSLNLSQGCGMTSR